MDDEPQSTDRRTRELARRAARQRRMNIVGSVLFAGIVVLVALVATDTLRLSGNGPSLASGQSAGTATTVAENSKSQVKKIKAEAPPRKLSHAAPLRLWIGGDSLSGELGLQLGQTLEKLGVVKTHVDYKVSSGLASNGVRDWPQRFAQEQAQYQPEAIVFMTGANDASIVGSAVDEAGVPVWEADYRTRVDEMMDLLVGGSLKRTVFWVGSPTLGTRYNHGAQELDRVMREEAAKRPTVVYVDAFSLFSSNGEYSVFLPDADGNRVQMRIGDGVHFTTEGAQFLADHVYKLLDSRWNLASQAVPGSPIDYTIEGSGRLGRRDEPRRWFRQQQRERERERLGHHDQPDHGRAGDDGTDHRRADDHAAENDIDHGSDNDDDHGAAHDDDDAGRSTGCLTVACLLRSARGTPEFSG